MAIFPWLMRYEWQGIKLDEFPNVQKYMERLQQRPAVHKALSNISVK